MSCQPSWSQSSYWFQPRARSEADAERVVDLEAGVWSWAAEVMRETSASSCSLSCTRSTLVPCAGQVVQAYLVLVAWVVFNSHTL